MQPEVPARGSTDATSTSERCCPTTSGKKNTRTLVARERARNGWQARVTGDTRYRIKRKIAKVWKVTKIDQNPKGGISLAEGTFEFCARTTRTASTEHRAPSLVKPEDRVTSISHRRRFQEGLSHNTPLHRGSCSSVLLSLFLCCHDGRGCCCSKNLQTCGCILWSFTRTSCVIHDSGNTTRTGVGEPPHSPRLWHVLFCGTQRFSLTVLAGGGDVGLMGGVSRAVRASGGTVLGGEFGRGVHLFCPVSDARTSHHAGTSAS